LFDAWHRKVRRQVKTRGANAERAYEALIAFHRSFRARTGINLGQQLFAEIHQAFGGELKYVVCGGAALSRDVAMEFEGIGLDIFQGYGMTEAAPVICAQRPDEPLTAGSVGPPIPGVQVRIHEPDGEGVGEIVARSPSLFLGYDGKEEETNATLRDGWLHTGDLGRLDESGHLHVVGRLKDAIVDAAGNTVHPDEVEDLYEGCDDISELAVAGVAKGEHDVVGALIVAKTDVEGGVEAARERIREFFRVRGETLPYPKRIKVLQFTPRALPRTPTRKVKRADVSRMLAERSRRASERGTKRRQRQAEAGLTRVAQVFQDVAGVDASQVMPESSLSHDLGLDSIALAEVVLALAEEYDRPAPRSLNEVATVRDLMTLLDQGNGTAAARPLEADPRPLDLPQPVRHGVSELLNAFQRVGYGKLLDCTVTGRGNIPHHTNCIVVANHASHLDVGLVKHALGEYGDKLVSAGARDYFFKDALTATYFENFTNVVAFDRMASVRESLERFVELVRQGKTVLIFPEGTRSVTGRLGALKPGLGLIVPAARVGVLPIYLSGTHQAMPKGTWLPRRDHPLEARIGPYLSPERLLGLTSHLGRRKQGTAIVGAVRHALCALRDKKPFDLEQALEAMAPPARGGDAASPAEREPARSGRSGRQA
jgi:long-chain acyl-CoA synthetase